MSAWTETLHDPTMALGTQELDELELLLGGLYGPESAYYLPKAADSGGPVEVNLEAPAETVTAAVASGGLLLTDADGTPLVRLSITDTSEATARSVYVAGPISALQPAEHPPARDIRLTGPIVPSGARTQPAFAAVFSRLPHADEISTAVLQAKTHGATLWLVALSVTGSGRTIFDLLEELRRCEAKLDNTRAGLLVVPRFNHPARIGGVTVGGHVLSRLNADEILDFTHTDDLDGAEARPLDPTTGGLVVLFTGLSGSGKSTLARALAEQFRESDRREVTLLDGDDVRRFLTAGLGFSREDRNMNVERIGWVASLIARTGGVAICAPIAPFEESRQRVRELAEAAGRYVLVHVSTPLEECENRDRKGLYAKARAGLIPDFTGIDSPYDAPVDADYVVDTTEISLRDSLEELNRVIADKLSIRAAN